MSVYTESPSLNDRSYDLNDQDWHPVGPAFEVNKTRDNTALELEYSGEVQATAINNGYGVRFQVRVNGKEPNFDSQGTLKAGNLQAEVSTKSIYVGLPAKSYKAQMFAKAPNKGATARGIVLDPGGWGERILVTEV